MNDYEELKPCPFCGGVASLCYEEDEGVYVKCTGCQIKIEFATNEEAIEAWNRRVE